MQRVGRFGEDLPGGGEVSVMVGEAFVEDIVENNSPGGSAAAMTTISVHTAFTLTSSCLRLVVTWASCLTATTVASTCSRARLRHEMQRCHREEPAARRVLVAAQTLKKP